MENAKLSTNFRKQSSLPPRCPFPVIPPSHGQGSKAIPKPKEGYRHHQRTSSESFLIEEQPSWLDELLDEPETPVRRVAHRRSSSDSFRFFEPTDMISNIDSVASKDWGSNRLYRLRDENHVPYHMEASLIGSTRNREWEAAFNAMANPINGSTLKEKIVRPVSREADGIGTSVMGKRDQGIFIQDPRERWEGSHADPSQSEMDSKRVKQQFAQRSRVRKLQYIAELEGHVQALQAEGLEASTELEFLDQQNLILNLENNALKQRLDSLSQEKLIKRLQQETLEREIARLKSLHEQQLQLQLQQNQQQPVLPTHGRSSSRDLDSQFAKLSLKHRDDLMRPPIMKLSNHLLPSARFTELPDVFP